MPVAYLKETPSQTAGPYVHIGVLPGVAGLDVRTQEALHIVDAGPGERIRLEGIVYDGAGAPVRDAVVELWQADAGGRYGAGEGVGWGRAGANAETGLYWFETVKPGATPWRDGRPQAPHVSLLIFARGVNVHLHTRAYFGDEEAANAADPVLRMVEPRERAATLVARPETRDGGRVYRFDIRLQGEGETVFLDM